MSHALKMGLRWFSPPNFFCYIYAPGVHRQPSKGWLLEKCEKKSKSLHPNVHTPPSPTHICTYTPYTYIHLPAPGFQCGSQQRQEKARILASSFVLSAFAFFSLHFRSFLASRSQVRKKRECPALTISNMYVHCIYIKAWVSRKKMYFTVTTGETGKPSLFD